MIFRYLAVVLLMSAVGAGLLGMRQQQLNDKHAIAEHHAAMKQDREQIKDLQVRIAKRTDHARSAAGGDRTRPAGPRADHASLPTLKPANTASPEPTDG